MGYGTGTRWVLGVALGVAALTAIGSPVVAAALPAPEALVPNTVARIDAAADRDDETISRAELRHALVLAADEKGLGRTPRPGEEEYEPLERTVLSGLIEAVWLRGQAEEMDIVVTRGEIRSLIAYIRRESFESAAEFNEFMRETPMTRHDLRERVELQLLAAALQERIVAGAKTAAEEQKAFKEFIDEFNERWRARTVCAPEHAIRYCSNGPPVEG
jgi:SurA N-terminal domain